MTHDTTDGAVQQRMNSGHAALPRRSRLAPRAGRQPATRHRTPGGKGVHYGLTVSWTLGERYEIGRRIGAGGMAEVFEAFDRRLGRRVAVKVLRSDLADVQARDRFEHEARLLARFNHPNAVTVFDVGEDDARPYLVMELVDGRDLAALLAESGSLDEDHAVAVMAPVLCALAAAHAAGIVHRDVKPANILLGTDGRVRLADFGIAKAFADATAGLTRAGQVIGTPRYLSPEQLRGEHATPRSDVYSAGIVMFEALAGGPPFPDDTIMASVAEPHRGVPSLVAGRPGLSAAILAVVDRALAVDPERRFHDAGAMRLALLRANPGVTRATELQPTSLLLPQPMIDATAVLALPEGVRPAPSPGRSPDARRRRVRRTGAVLVAIAVPALLIFGLVRAHADDRGSATVTVVPLTHPTSAATSVSAPSTTRQPERSSAPSTSVRGSTTTAPTAPITAPGPGLPATLDALVGLLAQSPSAYGPHGVTLLDQLREIQGMNPRKKAGRSLREAAMATISDIDTWVRDGTFAAPLAQRTQDLLRPLTS